MNSRALLVARSQRQREALELAQRAVEARDAVDKVRLEAAVAAAFGEFAGTQFSGLVWLGRHPDGPIGPADVEPRLRAWLHTFRKAVEETESALGARPVGLELQYKKHYDLIRQIGRDNEERMRVMSGKSGEEAED